MHDLGDIKQVCLREIWQDEARNFTPWLADNIQLLNEALHLELEVENTEVAAGPYSADILAKDTGTRRYVVIENQLEKTNHDHLGKAITYASVLDATSIIWISPKFTDEHRRALDWLNESTDDIAYYGVQIELWQIDDSKPAIRFTVVSKPSIDARIAKGKAIGELTEGKKTQLKFWEKYRKKLERSKKIPSLRAPSPQYWYDIALGKSGVFLTNRCNMGTNTVSTSVYISNTIAETMLPYLEGRKSEIESKIGKSLQWDPNPNASDKTIVLQYPNPTDFSDPQKFDEALDWLVEHTIKFYQVFSKIVKEFPK